MRQSRPGSGFVRTTGPPRSTRRPASMTWWAGPARRRENRSLTTGAELTADLELIRVVYEVFVEPADCPICGAPLDGAINVDVTGGFFTASRIVVATRCRGWRRHRHVANVIDEPVKPGSGNSDSITATDRTRKHT